MNQFAAEVLFLRPADVEPTVAALTELGCEFAVDHDAIDDHGPTVFGWVTGTTELHKTDIGNWLQAIVQPLGGDVVQWGFGTPPNLAPGPPAWA
jgi:hypothetical protein